MKERNKRAVLRWLVPTALYVLALGLLIAGIAGRPPGERPFEMLCSLILVAVLLISLPLGRSLERRASTDGATGLLNKIESEREITAALRRARGCGYALLLLDVDRLKAINDTYGHQMGDRAICCAAQALKAHFPMADVIGRAGGDEFVVLVRADGIEALTPALNDLQETLMASDVCPVRIGASVGIVFAKGDETDFQSLFHRADRAMYRAKDKKCGFAVYDKALDEAPRLCSMRIVG